MIMVKTIRITSDIDDKRRIIIIYYLIKSMILIKNITNIEINKSHSKGYHLIIWTKGKYNKKQVYKLREKLGDDKHRIKMDKLRTFGRDTLFYKKEVYPY
jgi:hypothetical protein